MKYQLLGEAAVGISVHGSQSLSLSPAHLKACSLSCVCRALDI